MARGIWLTIGGSLMGAGYLIVFTAATRLAPAEAVVLPMLLSAAVLNTCLSGLGAGRNPGGPRMGRLEIITALLLGLFSALGNQAMAYALIDVSPGIAAVLLRTQVIFVALGGMLVLSERVTLRFWLGAGIALGGLWLLKGMPGQGAQLSLAGVIWALTATVSFASMQVLVRRTIHGINPVRVNGLRLWFAAGIMACFPGRLESLAQAGPALWGLMIATALMGPVLSRILLMLGLRTLTAALSTLVLFTSPVFAYLLAGLVFGSWPGLTEIGASLVIMAGVALPVVEWIRSRRPAIPTV